jgi:hypothetical protein
MFAFYSLLVKFLVWSVSSDRVAGCRLPVLTQTWLSLQLLSALRKVRFLAIRLFIPTPADCEFFPLPSWLFFLYYPLRPFRVTCTLMWWIGRAGFRKLSPRARET